MATIGSMSEPTLPALLYKSKSAALFIIDVWCYSPQYVNDGMLAFSPTKQGLHISLSGECRCLAQSPDGRLTKEDGKCHPYHQPLQVLSFAYSTDVSQLGYSRAISAILAFTSAAFSASLFCGSRSRTATTCVSL